VDLKAWLHRCPIIAILRGIKPEEAESICDTLEKTGICIVEVPLNSPNALSSISILSRSFGSRMLIGAGTLTDPKQVAEVSAAGGRLIVTPHADTAIVRATKAANLLAVPGFFNPTEAFALLQAGADAIKLFPSEVLGVPMLKALQAVLPKNTIVIPVGGIDAEKIAPWMSAGALGFGAGSSIYKPGDTPEIVDAKARSLVNAVWIYQRSAQPDLDESTHDASASPKSC
jgi:2-dehydro-3-deoxyphosphogalactonate aldolase